jgi:hypothetical protein
MRFKMTKAELTKYFKYLDNLRRHNITMHILSLRLQEDWGLRQLAANDVLRHWVSSHHLSKTIEERVESTLDSLSKYSKTEGQEQ